MSAFTDLVTVYQHEGAPHAVLRTFGFLYEKHIRPHLPESNEDYIKLNGIVVSRPGTKILDRSIGLINYEGPLVRGMKECIEKGDTVVIVGGGYGVSTVIASELVGPEGRVLVFEGAENMVSNVRNTVAMRNIDNVEVNHNIVSEAISLYDDDGGAPIISPEELPDCDTLVLDCEGAELDILSKITQTPRSVVVETHGHYGAPVEEIRELLSGYKIVYDQSISKSKAMSVLGAKLVQNT
jgi:hypothetical protein